MAPSRRLLTKDEHAEATEVLGLAFDDDPMFRFLLQDDDREGWIRLVMSAWLSVGLRADSAFTTDGVRGVLGVVPPGGDSLPTLGLLSFLMSGSKRPKLRWPSSHLSRCGLSLLSLMNRLHIKEPHYYVQVIGVHPSHQGKGLARVLLEPVTRLADQDKVACYLETTKESNVGLYRHFGFEVTAEVSHQAAGQTFPPLWAMRRGAIIGE